MNNPEQTPNTPPKFGDVICNVIPDDGDGLNVATCVAWIFAGTTWVQLTIISLDGRITSDVKLVTAPPHIKARS